MQIQSIYHDNKTQNLSFHSIYRIYHWHKPEGVNKYVPAFDVKTAKKYQRQLLRLLNKMMPFLNKNPQNFAQQVSSYVARVDTDYKNNPFVRTVYNNQSGVKVAWNGNVYDVEPAAYLLTGRDAVDFEQKYGKPLGYAKASTTQEKNEKPWSMELADAKTMYSSALLTFVKEQADKFLDSNGKCLELHAIFRRKKGAKTSELCKIQFFQTKGKDNPLVTNRIIERLRNKKNID